MNGTLGKYDIYVPVNDNDGLPIGEFTVNMIQRRLLQEFKGYTLNPTVHEGVWMDADGVVYRDGIQIYTVFSADEASTVAMVIHIGWMCRQKTMAMVLPNGEARLIDMDGESQGGDVETLAS